MDLESYETVLFVARECFVYRVPPRSSTAGYKAAEWGDMEAFLWKGRLRIMEKSSSSTVQSSCSIRLEDSESGELFAESPYDITGKSVEPVLDSSRYFVLRVESTLPDGAKKRAYIGMGFQDRSDSFDFNVALQDWTKRQKAAANRTQDGGGDLIDDATGGPSPHIPTGPKKDFTLKEGETISIKLPGSGAGGRKITSGSNSNSNSNGAGGLGGFGSFGGGGPLLPPPPSKKR